MRNAFADEVTKMATDDDRVVLLSGDIGNKLFDRFKEIAAERFYNCGVAEANMMGVAAGLAMGGFRPIVYTITPFVTVRCLEQIRIDVCYHRLPVIIVGTGAGLSYASLGPTHHSCDDIGFLRMLPNMNIVCPCDPFEVRAAMRAAIELNEPVYVRLGKKGEPNIHAMQPQFEIGKGISIKRGHDLCILSLGNMMPVALTVADTLEERGISAQVDSFHTVKPLDVIRLREIFKSYSLVVTLEEHSIINGLGAAVSDWMVSTKNTGTTLLRFGTRDEFMGVVGSQAYAREFYHLTPDYISSCILEECATS